MARRVRGDGRVDRSRLRLLLASSSFAALLIGGGTPVFACVNGGGGYDNPSAAAISCIQVTGTSFAGNITNEGTISPGGITVTGGTITGAIQDSGPMIAGGISLDGTSTINSASVPAIVITGSTFLGGIINSGTITATGNISGFGYSGGAVVVTGVSTFAGGINNSGTIIATGQTVAGISVYNNSNFSGGITNSGTISAMTGGYSAGINVETISTFSGGISNGGIISVAGKSAAAIAVYTVSSFSGGIANSGTISATPTGGPMVGIFVDGSPGVVSVFTTFSGGITNSGTISAGSGIVVEKGISFSDGITNIGRISATTGHGIEVSGVSNFSGGINNSGTISAAGIGIAVGGQPLSYNASPVSTFSGGISNSGAISGNTGIAVVGVTNFSGAIANSGTIIGTVAAIDVSTGNGNSITIDQTGGLISGNIKLSTNADVVNISGGAINGNIVGQGSSDAINFALGSGNTFTYGPGYSFSGINQVNVKSGTVIFEGANSATNVAINGGGTLQVGNNSALGTSTLSFNGGTLQSGAGGPYTISNAATIATSGTIDANGNNFTYAGQIDGSGGLTIIDSANSGGVVALTGSNNYSGTTTVNSGTLDVEGSIASATTVNSGGTLSGGGNVGNVTVNSGGTLAPGTPGNAAGALAISGNLTLSTNLQVSANLTIANSSNYISQIGTSAIPYSTTYANVSGTANLGGTFTAAASNSATYAATDQGANVAPYTVLSASTVNGTFSGIKLSGSFGDLVPFLSYNTAGSVTLGLTAGTAWSGASASYPTTWNWSDTANWVGGQVPSASAATPALTVATFGASAVQSSVTIDTAASANTLLFTSTAPQYSFTITSGNSLTLNGIGIVNNSSFAPQFSLATNSTLDISQVSGAVSIPSAYQIPFALTGVNIGSLSGAAGSTINLGGTATYAGGNTLYVNQTAPGTFDGVISGYATPLSCSNGCPPQGISLLKDGAATLTLGGVNTYTGYTGVLEGTLALAGGGSIGSSAGVAINNGAAIDISQATNGATVQSLQTITPQGQSTAATGTVYLGNQALTVLTSGSYNGNEFDGIIADGGISGKTGGQLIVSGSGTLALGNVNSYTGQTTINSGATLALVSQYPNCNSGGCTPVANGDIIVRHPA